MQHKISEFCDVVYLMNKKAEQLYKLKYESDSPDQTQIRFLIDDIQALALQLAHDKSRHPKVKN